MHKTVLMCVNAVESNYQLLNKCKLLFDLVLYHQHPSLFGRSLREISPNITFYFVMQFMSKRTFYFETEGVSYIMGVATITYQV